MNRIIIFLCLLFAFFSSQSSAESKKMAVIDTRIVEVESIAVTDMLDKVKTMNELIQSEVAKKEKELQEEMQKLERSRSLLSESAITQRQQAMQQKIMEWQDEFKKESDAMEKAKLDGLSEVDKKAKQIVEKIGKKHDIDVVFSAQSVLFSKEGFFSDLTNDFIKELNQDIDKVDFISYYKKHGGKYAGDVSKKGKKVKK